MSATSTAPKADWLAMRNADRTPNPTCPDFDANASTVLHVDAERGLTYTWFDISPDSQDDAPRDSALETALLTVTNRDGIRVGHLRVSYTTKAFIAQTFSRPLEWVEDARGWCIGFRAEKRGYGEPLTPQKLWANAFRYADERPASGTPRASWCYEVSDAPDEATIASDLAALEKNLAKKMRAHFRWQSIPFVAYANVETEVDGVSYRGTGVGRQMYLLAAQRLATTGRVLRASGCQTGYAERLWKRLAADPTVPTRKISTTHPTSGIRSTGLCLDYTKR